MAVERIRKANPRPVATATVADHLDRASLGVDLGIGGDYDGTLHAGGLESVANIPSWWRAVPELVGIDLAKRQQNAVRVLQDAEAVAVPRRAEEPSVATIEQLDVESIAAFSGPVFSDGPDCSQALR